MSELSATMAALQRIGDAVTSNDVAEYRAAVSHAREVGCTEYQISDSYYWRNQLRIQSGIPATSFDVDGN